MHLRALATPATTTRHVRTMCLLLILLTLSAAACGQVITTVAGSGATGLGDGGFSGDGGAATGATLNIPSGVAVDGSGNFFIVDSDNNRIRRVSNGIITTVAGNGNATFSGDGGPATAAGMNPNGVAVDSSGNLFIADGSNNRVRRVSNGIITTVAGDGTQGFSGDGGPAPFASLSGPYAVAVDGSGNLFIADSLNYRIRRVDASTGNITTVAGSGPGFPSSPGFAGDGGPATAAQLNVTYGVALDGLGNLFIADSGNDRIRRVSNGIITTVAGDGVTFFGGDGGPGTAASLNGPQGLAVDAAHNLLIADWGNHRIRLLNTGTGIITTVVGGAQGFSGDGGSPTAASLYLPGGVALDSSGNIFIADSGNNRIRLVGSAVSHDDPATTSITISTGSSTMDTTGATSSPNDPLPGCGNNSTSHSVWTHYHAPANGTITVDTSGSSYVTIVGSWQGTPGGTPTGCAVGSVGTSVKGTTVILGALLQITATAGKDYWIMTSAANNDGGKLQSNLGFKANSVLAGMARSTSLPHVVRGGGYVTKMTVTNMTRTTNNVVLNYVAPDGTLVESQTTQLSPAGTARIATPEAQRSQTAALQWATVGSDAGISTNLFFELADANGTVLNTVGFNDAPPVTSFVIPVEFEIAVGRTVGLALSNPSITAASVTLNLVNAQGTVIATSTIPLAAFAKTSFDVSSTAPFQAALAALGNVNFIGTLTGSSTVPVNILGVGDDKGPFFSTPPLPAGATRLVIPHMVIGGGFLTKLTFVNLTASANTATVTYYSQSGAVLTNTGLPASVLLAANGAARIAPPESARTAGAQISWALVTSTGALGVNLFFEFANGNGAIVNTIGFNQVPELTSFTFPVEMEQSNQVFVRTVGLALANAGAGAASITLTLLDQTGAPIATYSPTALAALNQTSTDLSTIAAFKAVLPAGNFIGSVTVTSNVPIVGLALEADRGPFSAVPPVAGTPQ